MKGDVLIHIEGLRLEKLIQRALSEGAHFISIRHIGDRAIIVDATQHDAGILLELCRRYSISARVTRMRGKPVFLSHLQKRWTAAIGAAICAVLCWMFLGRIWIIDVNFTGAQAALGDSGRFISQLDDLGVRPGISNRLDASLLSGKLEATQAGYSYVSANLQGIRLLIEAAPEVPEPEVYDLAYARDLYASIDGIVLSVEVHSGIACVQPGDIIKRGQLLIRGEEQISKEEVHAIGARGEVMVRTWYQGVSEGSLREVRKVPTGRKSSSAHLELMGHSLPITTGENFSQFHTRVRHLPVGGLYLPLEIVFEDRIETSEKVFETDREALADHLCALAMADAAMQLSLTGPEEYEIARSWINFDTPSADTLTASAVYEIYTDAAATRGALLQGG